VRETSSIILMHQTGFCQACR